MYNVCQCALSNQILKHLQTYKTNSQMQMDSKPFKKQFLIKKINLNSTFTSAIDISNKEQNKKEKTKKEILHNYNFSIYSTTIVDTV